MFVLKYTLAPDLSDAQWARVKELVGADLNAIPFDFSAIDEANAVEAISIIESVSLEEARNLLEQRRRLAHEPSELSDVV